MTTVPVHPHASNHTNQASTVVRRITGPEAHELFVACRPEGGATDPGRQAEAVYRAVVALLAAEGASLEALTSETLFFRNIREDLTHVLDARERVFRASGVRACPPLPIVIEQPPLDAEAHLALSTMAVIPRGRQPPACDVLGSVRCGCEACSEPSGRIVRLADQTYLYAGNIHGTGASAFDEVYGMFCAAEEVLSRAGMTVHHLVRTWLYLRDIDRDYAELNRARREFFRDRGIEVRPASTGIGGAPFPDGHDFSLSLYAVRSPRPLAVGVMSAPTFNEPWFYGADFSRGLKVVEANKVALYVSGTASVDEAGRTAHVGDLPAQVDRLLVNLSALLAGQGASFRDVVSAVTYVKHPMDAALLRATFRDRGFDGFPSVLVRAPICRPDLLCETEAVAVLPLSQPAK